MKLLTLTLVLLSALAQGATAPLLTVADSINPGTGDYMIRGIRDAERAGSPYVVIELDTPGGLLHTTRRIVQQMLNAHVPVVVYIGPRGAQAGSAGAILTYASDVAAMAPGTNIGAAHPVGAGGEKLDDTMKQKIENDTAAFAESLAKLKGRNADWAIRSVRSSASIPAAEALKKHVIDLTADDTVDLSKKLEGWKLNTPKYGITSLPQEAVRLEPVPMTVKQRLVSFFADPSLAYLIMALGGLCIWVELTHPGLVFPGVLGALCLIVSLVSFQMLPIDYGALALILVGMGMLIAELFFPTYGMLGVGGLACFIVGSLFLMDTNVPEFRISLSLILPTATVLAGFASLLGVLVWRSRRTRRLSGMEAMVGEYAEVREPLAGGRRGKVFVRGELWNAVAEPNDHIPSGEIVIVKDIKDFCLIVEPRPRGSTSS